MNILLLDTLTDISLRDNNTLEATIIDKSAAGLPWLTGEQ